MKQQQMPRHVAVIMDGNGRWAQQRGLSFIEGHRRGIKAAQDIVKKAAQMGVEVLTLWAFSQDNWQRPTDWVNALMDLLREHFQRDPLDWLGEGVRLRIIGNRTHFPHDIQELFRKQEEASAHQKGMLVQIALSYSGRQDLTQAFQQIAYKICAQELAPESISAQLISDHLYTAGVPDPDLLIRTSGEARISNFMMWQLTYTELVFTDILWPDYSGNAFEQAIQEFEQRERRYGATFGSIE